MHQARLEAVACMPPLGHADARKPGCASPDCIPNDSHDHHSRHFVMRLAGCGLRGRVTVAGEQRLPYTTPATCVKDWAGASVMLVQRLPLVVYEHIEDNKQARIVRDQAGMVGHEQRAIAVVKGNVGRVGPRHRIR